MFYLKVFIFIELFDWVLVVVFEYGIIMLFFEVFGLFLLFVFNFSLMQFYGNYCIFGILCYFKVFVDLLLVVFCGGV